MKHVVSYFLYFCFLFTIECECDGGYFGIAIHSDEDNAVTFSFSHVATDLVDRYFILQFCTLLTAVVTFIL